MVLVDNKKYACETCIKGHRSSSCKHTDRPLFEIKKKGRPVTQCDHCRELRKTKQVHVKCICELKDDALSDTPSNPPSTSSAPRPRKKGKTKVPDSAAFPHGLPEALEASVALPSSSESVSSDSDHGGSCSCKSGGECHCCTPRKSAPRKAGSSGPRGGATAASTSRPKDRSPVRQSTACPSSPMQTQIMARIAELRPVLPKPAPLGHHAGGAEAGPVHHPSSGIPHANRHHNHHDRNAYSPYNRAYEHIYSNTENTLYDVPQNSLAALPQNDDPRLPPEGFGSHHQQLQHLQLVATWNDALAGLGQSINNNVPPSFPSACGCGDNCQCPGCIEHNPSLRAPSPSAFSSCANPGACSSCLDCTILSLPASIPPEDSTLAPTDPYQSQALEDWFRRVSGNISSPSMSPSFGQPDVIQQPNIHSGTINSSQQVPDLSENFVNAMRCFGETCNCPPGMCQCIQCEGYSSSAPETTFDVSGERDMPYQQQRTSRSYGSSSTSNVSSSSLRDPGRQLRHGHGARQGMSSSSSLTAPRVQPMTTLGATPAENLSGAWAFSDAAAPVTSRRMDSIYGYARSGSGSSSSLDDSHSSDSPFGESSMQSFR